MTYIKGSFAHHTPSDDDGTPTCLYCLEPWPCDPELMRREVRDATVKEVVAMVRPDTSEPLCCDVHASSWTVLGDMADELELWAQIEREGRK